MPPGRAEQGGRPLGEVKLDSSGDVMRFVCDGVSTLLLLALPSSGLSPAVRVCKGGGVTRLQRPHVFLLADLLLQNFSRVLVGS